MPQHIDNSNIHNILQQIINMHIYNRVIVNTNSNITNLYLIIKKNNILQSHEIQRCNINNATIYFDNSTNMHYVDGTAYSEHVVNILLQKDTTRTISDTIKETMQIEINTNIISLDYVHKRYCKQLQQLLQDANTQRIKTTRLDHNPDKRMLQSIIINNELRLSSTELFTLFITSHLCTTIINLYNKLIQKSNANVLHNETNIANVLQVIMVLNTNVEKTYTHSNTNIVKWKYCMSLLCINCIKSIDDYTPEYNVNNIHNGIFTLVTLEKNKVSNKQTHISALDMLLCCANAINTTDGFFANFLLQYRITYNLNTHDIDGIYTLNGFLSCFNLLKNNFLTVFCYYHYFWNTCDTLEFGIGTQLPDTCVLIFNTNCIKKILSDVLYKNVSHVIQSGTFTQDTNMSHAQYITRYTNILHNFNNIEAKLAIVTNNIYGTIITSEFLQKFNCVVTGSAISSIISEKSFIANDIDILVTKENYKKTYIELYVHPEIDKKYINVKNIVNNRHVFKLKNGFCIDLFCSNLYNVGYMSTIQRFHVSCVRAYWDGKQIMALPSYVNVLLSNIIEKSRYISTAQSVAQVYKKYNQRGFNISFANSYCKQFFNKVL